MDGLLEELKNVILFDAMAVDLAYEDFVIFLFGRVFRYLNFDDIIIGKKVEELEGFDAIAYRNAEQIIIEFKSYSSGFKNQLSKGYDPKNCDLIVCWKDDWGEECPVNDVLELEYFWKKAQEKP